ncbi:MAG: viologen exporter family transport system permease protein [Actinomycetota bacterium]|nr:viologen exporter family transport system permease protein [Actinomycetota bacterium]
MNAVAGGVRWFLVPAGMAARRMIADRSGLVVAVFFYLLVSVTLSSLWRAAAGHQGSVAGYSADSLTWYAFAAEAAICGIAVRLVDEIGEEIATGVVTAEMLRPASVVGVRLATVLGRSLTLLGVLLVPGTALAWTIAGPPPGLGPMVALVLPAFALAVTINVIMQHVAAAASFWLRDIRAAWFLYQKLVFVLGGMLLPLEVLPDSLRTVASCLPFMAMAYVPARLAAGHPAPELLVVQAGWLVVAVALAVAVFAAGQRRVEVTGG